MRHISIEDASQRANIDKSKLEQAEDNKLILTNDELERLSIVLDTHPGLLAFPTWDHIEYKSVKVDLDGSAYINGNLHSKKLSGWVTKRESLEIHLSKRKSISLFTKGIVSDHDRLTSYCKIKGDNLGWLNDIYQAGPDFDGDNREIKELEITTSLFKNGLVYHINGVACDCGKVSKARPVDSPEGNWKFNIQFVVKQDQIRDFFGIYQYAADQKIKRMAALEDFEGEL